MDGTPEIAAERDGPTDARESHRHECGAEDMAGAVPGGSKPRGDVDLGVEIDGGEALGRGPRVGLGVERPGRMVLGEAGAVGVGGVLLLEVATVGQHDPGERAGAPRREDVAPEAVPHERGEVAGVVEVRMGDEHGVDRRGVDRERLPIS
jgi:hypothetical protein